VICPLCGQRKARRHCPALDQQICPTCCGTKRLVEIQCPSDCPYLASSREHPPAAALRRQQQDVGVFVRAIRDLNEQQSHLFLVVTGFLLRYDPRELQAPIDDDIADAAAALAATLETSSRGVIYEHQPASLPAQRLAASLKPLLAKAGEHGGTPFERDAAVVLRRIEEAARQARQGDHANRRAFLDLAARVVGKDQPDSPASETSASDASGAPRLILP
jgi:hypothetical protein